MEYEKGKLIEDVVYNLKKALGYYFFDKEYTQDELKEVMKDCVDILDNKVLNN